MARMTAKWFGIGAVFALLSGWLAAACESSGGGSTCFSPASGPDGPSCDAYEDNLVCPVSLTPWYSCTCTPADADAGADAGGKQWVCMPSDTGASGGGGMDTGGTGGTGTGGAGTGGTGTGGTGTGGSTSTGDAGS